jgi:uncharacterized membrane protein YbhN (UPF0104 family)
VGTSLLALAFHQSLPVIEALILLAGLGLSSMLPSTPGALGIYQFVGVNILTPLGFQREAALAYILIAQATNYLVVICWGILGLWRLNLRSKTPKVHEGPSSVGAASSPHENNA